MQHILIESISGHCWMYIYTCITRQKDQDYLDDLRVLND
jgi:hypothetical protein